MVTKDQERAALEQIKKIVTSLGEDSYIATAFDGVWDMAKMNIENDWACSVASLSQQVAAHDDEIRGVRMEAEASKRSLNALVKDQEKVIVDLKAKIAGLENQLDEATACAEQEDMILTMRSQISDLELLVVRLKAKIFDLTNPGF